MRNQFHKQSAVAGIILASLFTLSSGATAQAVEESMTFRNGSAFDIREIYLSKTNHRTWEEDVLHTRILSAGDSIRVGGIDPGRYDIKLVDEDGDVCIVHNIDLYSNRVWTISNAGLLDCESR
jgi:hypothetical protein